VSRETLSFGPPADEAEQRALAEIVDYAFGRSGNLDDMLHEPRENLWVARSGTRVIGGLGAAAMGQWFGGRSVPMAAVYAVAIAPEWRSTGIGAALMRDALGWMRGRGLALSTLFPATQSVYRRVGYEQSGMNYVYEQPIATLPTDRDGLAVRRAHKSDRETLQRLYAERAAHTAGNLDRDARFWDDVLESKREQVDVYLVEQGETAQGYAAFAHRKDPDGRVYTLSTSDLVARTPQAARALLGFFAGHRATRQRLQWAGPAADPLRLHLPNQDCTVSRHKLWMLRILDVEAALTARGYSPDVDAELHLDLRDDVLPVNAGCWTMRVANGNAQVQRGGSGNLRLDVRGLAPLYSGLHSAEDLVVAGLVDGDPRELARTSTIFAGPAPWMPDHF